LFVLNRWCYFVILGDKGKPFAQELPLGWVIIGEVCLGKVHAPTEISVRKTHVLNNGRSTTFLVFWGGTPQKEGDTNILQVCL
jgi:hypothetical protein